MSSRLLPTGSSPLELAAAQACAEIQRVPVPLKPRSILIPVRCICCPIWRGRGRLTAGMQTGRSGQSGTLSKRQCSFTSIRGTIGALRRVVEPLGYLISVTEWWKTGDRNGTFRLTVGVSETGITEETYYELERLIFDAKPLSRHLLGLSINLSTSGNFTAVLPPTPATR